MSLIGKVRYDEYEVKMKDSVGNVRVEYVLAPDVERAYGKQWSYPANVIVH